MYTRILVPLDGSARAERAIPAAWRLARSTAGAILLLHAMPPPSRGEPYLDASLRTPSAAARKRMADYLDRHAAELHARGIPTEALVRIGSPADTILAVAREESADCIILCARRRTVLSRLALGGASRRVIQEATSPVLVLRDGAKGLPPFDPYAPLPRGRVGVLVPLDGSRAAEEALAPALALIEALATPGEAVLHLARVLPAFAAAAEGKQAEAYLERVAERLRGAAVPALDVRVTWTVAFDSEAALALRRIAEGGEEVVSRCDLIAMTTYTQGGLMRMLLGGVTEQMLAGTRLPVLIVRPTQAVSPPEATSVGKAGDGGESHLAHADQLAHVAAAGAHPTAAPDPRPTRT